MPNSKEWKALDASRKYKFICDTYKNAKCMFCGCNRDIEFHHYNSNEKYMLLKRMNRCSWKNIIEEFKKCWPLCSKCHSQLHKGLVIPFSECYENGYAVLKPSIET